MRLTGKRQYIARVAIAGFVATGLAACGGEDEPVAVEELDAPSAVVQELDKLYDAAKEDEQKEVLVYQAAPMDESVWEIFEARYPGIDVKTATLYGAEFVSKLEQEHGSGNGQADVVLQGASSIANQAEAGYFADYEPAGSDQIVEVGRDEGLAGNCVAPFGDAAALIYNSDKVSEAEAPKGWNDLLDPKWRGRIVLAQLDKPGTTSRTLSLLDAKSVIDDQWLDELVDQQPVGIAESTQVGGALTSGQGDVTLGRQSFLAADVEKGAPLKAVYPTEGGSVMSASFGCVMANAPHADAGRLLLSWMFTKEAQESLASVGYYPFVEGVQPTGDFPVIEDVRNFITVPASEEPALIVSMTEKLIQRFG